MDMRCLMMATALISVAATPAAARPAKPASCPPTTAFNPTMTKLTGYRVFVGKDGDSEVEPLTLDSRAYPMLKTGKTLHIIDLPTASARPSQIVVGPANVELPFHPSPYKEMFVLLGGSFVFRTARFSVAMGPGSVLLMDDMGATKGHGGTIGPCGYVSLSIQPPADTPKP
jgi:hypothetical protein